MSVCIIDYGVKECGESIMNTREKRVLILAQWARENPDAFRSMNLWFHLERFAKEWGIKRKTISTYLPDVRKLLRHDNATFEQASLE
jgi:hypothetical protein